MWTLRPVSGHADYLGALDVAQSDISGYDNRPVGRYNVAPGSRVLILHNAADGLRIDRAIGAGRRSGPPASGPRRSMRGWRR